MYAHSSTLHLLEDNIIDVHDAGVLFNTITKMESSLADTRVERLFLRVTGSKKANRSDQEMFVDSPELRGLLSAYHLTPKQLAIAAERQRLGYMLGYCRIPGIDNDILKGLYTGLDPGPEVRIT
jgi:hypothetical protein